MIATMKKLSYQRFDWQWLVIFAGSLAQGGIIVLMVVLLHFSKAQLQGDTIDHMMIGTLAGIFCLAGIVIFLRVRDRPAATIAYGVFVCASLIFCLLLLGSYTWSDMFMSRLSMIAHGLAATSVYLFTFPSDRRKGGRWIVPYLPPILSLLVSILSLPLLILFPVLGTMVSFVLIYAFPLACMAMVTWLILFGLRRLKVPHQPLAGMTVVGMVFLFLSLAIINGKSTLYHVSYLPSSTGFLILYAVFVMGVALFTGIIVWSLRRAVRRALHITIAVGVICVLLLLVLTISLIKMVDLTFVRLGLTNLFTYHLLSVPLMVLPVVCCYALIHQQLSGKVSVLSRQFIRGMLWCSLAGCFVITDIMLVVLGKRVFASFAERNGLFIHIFWLLLSFWLFPQAWEKVRILGDQMFYRDFYHYNRTLHEMSMSLTHLHSLGEICAFLLPRLTILLNAAEAVLLVQEGSFQNGERGKISSASSHWQKYHHSAQLRGMSQESLMKCAHVAATYFTEPSRHSLIFHEMLLFPLYDGSLLRGCLCLGPKLNSEPYSRQDLSFLETLTAQLAVLEVNSRYLDQVRADAQQLAALNHRLMHAQEEERRRLALELHDDVLQQAMLLTRQLTDMSRSTPPLAEVVPLAHSVVNSLRTTCLTLRPPLLDELGLAEALRWLARQTEQHGKIRVSVHYVGDTTYRFSSESELALYRVAQEALANVLKHAQASLVCIRLRYGAQGMITLLIADNGCGVQTECRGAEHLGVAGMEERMEAIHGTFRLRTSPDQGVVIRATYRTPTVNEQQRRMKCEDSIL